MRIAIATVQVPFMKGGAEILVELLCKELKKRGHEAEIVTIPFKWYPSEQLVNSMMIGRMMDLSESNGKKIDVVIAMKFPAFYTKHENKVLWLMHQHRQAYDFYETNLSDMHLTSEGRELHDMIVSCDNKYIDEAKGVFTIAQNTSNRLKKYNGIDSIPLYSPPLNYEKLHCTEYGDFVFYPSRIESIKRQRLLVESARYIKTDAKIIIAGGGSESEINYLKELISKYSLQDKVTLAGFVSEEEKIDYYARSLCVYFGAYDEDYGYITLEGFFSEKPVIVHKDAGGPLEFVEDDVNGYVVDETPEAIAKKIDYLYNNKATAEKMGKAARQSLIDKNMNWDYVIEQLLSCVKIKGGK